MSQPDPRLFEPVRARGDVRIHARSLSNSAISTLCGKSIDFGYRTPSPNMLDGPEICIKCARELTRTSFIDDAITMREARST